MRSGVCLSTTDVAEAIEATYPKSEYQHCIVHNVFIYYLAYDALTALTDPYGVNGIEDGTDIVDNIIKWTDGFKKSVPTWYLKDFYA